MPAPNPIAILQAAVALRDAGCTVVPTRKDGGKAPAGKWKDYQTTPPTGDQIADWFARQGHTGIGIITGKASANVEMLELEGRAVQAGMLEQIEDLAINSGLADLYDRVTQGWCESTPSGGIHWYYRLSDGIVPGNTKLATTATHEVLAETRGEGGFSVVAPSHGNVHPTGLPWAIISGGPATIATLTWEERDAFQSLFRALADTPGPEPSPEPARTTSPTLRPGDDFNARATWADILTPHGWTLAYTDRDGVGYWRRPGKSDGISATTGRNDGDNLYVFSTSTSFDTETAHSKFAAYTLLNHNGDYAAAARQLSREGYGDAPTNAPTDLRPLATDLRPTITPTSPDQDDESTWAPINLQPHLDGTHITPLPQLLARTDHNHLLYAGRVHSFYGESESGKSWIAQIAAAQALTHHQPVTYIDFEADAADIVARLRLLGVPGHLIAQHLTYLRPETPRNPEDTHWQALLTPGAAALVIIDGVTEALTMWGGETKDNDAITRWMRLFPRAIARATGAAVVTIDHVAKDAQTRGRFAIGGQAKLAAIDGAAYLIEPIEPIAPGQVGALAMRVTKDRPGAVRRLGTGWRSSDRTQAVAVVQLDSSNPGAAHATIYPPKSEEQVIAERRDTMAESIIQRALADPGIGLKRLSTGHGFRMEDVQERIRQLIDDGMLVNRGSNTAFQIHATDDGAARFGGRKRLDEGSQ